MLAGVACGCRDAETLFLDCATDTGVFVRPKVSHTHFSHGVLSVSHGVLSVSHGVLSVSHGVLSVSHGVLSVTHGVLGVSHPTWGGQGACRSVPTLSIHANDAMCPKKTHHS